MDDATISVLSAAVKRDEPPVGDKALAYTRGGPSLKDADNPEVVRTNFESVTRFLTEFAEYHAGANMQCAPSCGATTGN